MNQLYLVGGGARSGKSRKGEVLALQLGERPIYLASAQAYDQEIEVRIQQHRLDRGELFKTVEEPIHIMDALAQVEADVILWDCLTLWLSNMLLREVDPPTVERQLNRILDFFEDRFNHTIIVTNEVGLGVVPEHTLARTFRDLAGRCHQNIAQRAGHVYAMMMGLCLRLKPAPVAVVEKGVL